MSRNSRVGKTYKASDMLKHIPDEDILVEAAIRRGEPLSQLIKPVSASQAKANLARWKQARAAAQNPEDPNMNPMYELYDDAMIDLLLSSNVLTRTLRVQQAKFQLVDDQGKTDPEATALLEKQWFLDYQKYALEAIFEHFRLLEFMDFDDQGELRSCVAVNKYHVKAKKGIVTKEPNDDEGTSFLEPPVSSYYLPIGKPDEMGMMFKVIPIILAIKSAVAQWNEFNEKMGIPFRTVTTNASDTKRAQQLGVIMEEMGSAGWAVLNEGEKVTLLDMAGTDPTKCFQSLIQLLDSRIATYLLGQSSTTSSDKNKGTYGSLSILQEISEVIHEADLTVLKYLTNDQLLPKLAALSPKYKIFEKRKFQWDKSVELSVKEVVEYVVQLSSEYEIDPAYITEKTGIPILGKKQATGAPTPPADPKKKSPVNSERIAEYYAVSCCSHDFQVSAAVVPSFEEVMLTVAKQLFDGKQKGLLDKSLLYKTSDFLLKAVLSGFKPITEDSDKLDIALLNNLKDNVYVFSGFKTYETLRVMTDLLVDKDQKIRTWSEYKTEVLKVNSKYNLTYLRAEYDNAVVSATQASQWNDIQKTKKDLPFLKFVATLDDRTTDICRGLDGMTRKADDPVWKQYFLPLHWKERSLIQQLADATETDMSTIILPELQPMFQQNVGISGAVFPDTHPYYDISQAEKKKVNKELDKYRKED